MGTLTGDSHSQDLDIMEESSLNRDSNKKTKAKEVEEEDVVPKLTDSDRLALFGGDQELLTYYLDLRQLAQRARHSGNQWFCDLRDDKMKAKLKLEEWHPPIYIKDLKDNGEDVTEFGFSSKQTALDDETAEKASGCDSDNESSDRKQNVLTENSRNEPKSFVCGVHGCSAQFASLASHESHYHTSHNFVCHVCRRTFVSNFLLDIHLEENHDSYFQVLSPRVDMYRCLVESCSLKFRTADVRKDHLVMIHKFPARFSFHGPVNDKPQKAKASRNKSRGGKNNKCSSSNNNNNSMDVSQQTTTALSSATCPDLSRMDEAPKCIPPSPAEMEVDQRNEKSEDSGGTPVSARGKGQPRSRGRGSAQGSRGRGGRVPTTICFGRGSQRAFQHRGGRGRHWHQTQSMDVDTTVDIEKVDFSDMVHSLDG